MDLSSQIRIGTEWHPWVFLQSRTQVGKWYICKISRILDASSMVLAHASLKVRIPEDGLPSCAIIVSPKAANVRLYSWANAFRRLDSHSLMSATELLVYSTVILIEMCHGRGTHFEAFDDLQQPTHFPEVHQFSHLLQ